jgi:hypothetical protein
MQNGGGNFDQDITSELSARRNAVRQVILGSMQEHKKFGGANDTLQFLVTIKPTALPPEIKAPIILKNSWKKRSFNYLIIASLTSFLLYKIFLHFDFSQWWHFILVVVLIGTVAMYLLRFFENRIVLEVSSEGLKLDNYIFTKWEDIEYLYYKTKHDGEGAVAGTYLVKKLKIDFEHEVRIDNLPWSAEQLGVTLYQCMRRYGSN